MVTNVNHVRNPHFALGKASPRHWEASFDPRACEAHRRAQSAPGDSTGIVMIPKSAAPAFWRQTLRCKPDAYYRVEAQVRCELVPAGPLPGFVLTLEHDLSDGDELTRLETPPITDAPAFISVRTYFHAPVDCDEVRVAVGVRNAVGLLEISDVRFIRILEPEELSHPHAILPPFVPGLPPIESVCICSNAPTDRPLAALLALAMGDDRISTMMPDQLRDICDAEAILLPDADAPPAIKSLSGLFQLAEKKLVLISLPAFVSLTRGALSLRRIEQPDDPIHARVVFANDATRGFTLHDSFAYAWPGKSPASFVQNQIRKSDGQKAFFRKHKFETLLVSNCDKDSTSDHPMGLFRQSTGGGLYVLDINPVDGPSSTMSEPALAAHLLLTILRRSPSPAGQFTVPVRGEVQLRDMIREAANRWDHFYVHDDDVPSDEVTHQIVTIGREDEMYGLPVAPKPVILLRSGLTGGDCESVYGVWAWLRQLLLHHRHPASYAAALAAKFRLAWVPCSAPWEFRDGWAASHAPPSIPTEIEMAGGHVAALIDVCGSRSEGVRVIFGQPTPLFRRAETMLPLLANAFSQREFPPMTCGAGNGPGSRRDFSWKRIHAPLSVITDPDAFDSSVHREIRSGGGDSIRIELPFHEGDFVARSIHQTHLAVTALEHVVGLLFGVIAVNRTRSPVALDGIGIVPPGESIVLEQNALKELGRASRIG